MKTLRVGDEVWLIWDDKVVANGRPTRGEITNGRATIDSFYSGKVQVWFGGCGSLAHVLDFDKADVFLSQSEAKAELKKRKAARKDQRLQKMIEKVREAGYEVTPA